MNWLSPSIVPPLSAHPIKVVLSLFFRLFQSPRNVRTGLVFLSMYVFPGVPDSISEYNYIPSTASSTITSMEFSQASEAKWSFLIDFAPDKFSDAQLCDLYWTYSNSYIGTLLEQLNRPFLTLLEKREQLANLFEFIRFFGAQPSILRRIIAKLIGTLKAFLRIGDSLDFPQLNLKAWRALIVGIPRDLLCDPSLLAQLVAVLIKYFAESLPSQVIDILHYILIRHGCVKSFLIHIPLNSNIL